MKHESHFINTTGPKNGRKYKVLAICRISTVHQDEKSLDDQEALYHEWLRRNLGDNYELIALKSQGKGEELDRSEYLEAIELVETNEFDIVILEDLGRLCCRVHSVIFCELCQDHKTRLIGLNDNVDTHEPNWKVNSMFSAMRQESNNQDTSLRIRRSLRNRFTNGGQLGCQIYGYVKAAAGDHENDLQKDREAEPIVNDIFAA